MSEVVAILCSDLHLSVTPPVSRSVETNWLEAQSRHILQLRDLAAQYDCTVVCAGDVFDRWNAGPEIINFAINALPKMYAIPGQHDLPLHSYQDIKKSAYWTLVEAGIIKNIGLVGSIQVVRDNQLVGLRLYGFPWGFPATPLEHRDATPVHLAVIHEYFWREGRSYPGAPEERNARVVIKKQLAGYTSAVFGDNHHGFTLSNPPISIINTGCLIQRDKNEKKYTPQVGLLYSDGTIKPHFLDCSEDKWLEDNDEMPEIMEDRQLQEFINELADADVESIDFREAIKRYIRDNKVQKDVEKVILEVLE